MKFFIKLSAEIGGEITEVETEIALSPNFYNVVNDCKTSMVSEDTKNVMKLAIGQELFNALAVAPEGSYPQLAKTIEGFLVKL